MRRIVMIVFEDEFVILDVRLDAAGTDLPQLAVVYCHCRDCRRSSRAGARRRRPPARSLTVASRTAWSSFRQGRRAAASRQSATQHGERTEKAIGPPVRDPGHDQMPRRGDASDLSPMIDMLRDQSAGERAHSDFVSAIPDRDRLPRPGGEKLSSGAVYEPISTPLILRGAPSALRPQRSIEIA